MSNSKAGSKAGIQTSLVPSPEQGIYTVKCHCGRIRAHFLCNRNSITVWDCNCSDCAMRRNIHLVVPSSDFELSMNRSDFEDATILYEWGTKTAKRRFCKTCGILAFYTPRSNTDGVAITLPCIDFGDSGSSPTVIVKNFDGIHWEESFKKTGISSESKKDGDGND